MLKLAWRNIWRNKNRSLISISAVFFCVIFAIVLRSFQLGTYSNMIHVVMGSYFGYVQINAPGFSQQRTLDESFLSDDEVIQTILQVPGVEAAAPRLEQFALASSGELTKPALIMGLDITAELSGFHLEKRVTDGRALAKNDIEGIVLGVDLAKQLKTKVGDTLVFISQGYMGQSAFAAQEVLGVVRFQNPELNKNLVLMPLPAAQEMFAAEGRITSLALGLKKGADYNRISSRIKQLPGLEKMEVSTWEDVFPEIVQSIQADTAGGMIIILVLYVLIGFVLLGTVIMMTAERMVEFGILIALGMKKSLLAWVTLLEKVMLTLLGGLLGILVTRPVVYYFHHNPIRFNAELGQIIEDYGFEPVLPASTDWSIALTHGIIVVLLGITVSIYAVLKIRKIHPVKAMRP